MFGWLRRKPKDRWPEWRPDQVLTPENRTMIQPWAGDVARTTVILPHGSVTFPARDEEALALLKSDPDEYFRRSRP